jgi:hypothetical protein
MHLRTQENFTDGFSQALFRPGITYHLNEQARITAGLAYIHHFPAAGHRNVALPEYRPWMQLQWNQNYDRLRLMQWVRIDQRNKSIALNDSMRSESFSQIYRVRMNIMLQWPLIKKPGDSGALFAILNNELMINVGKQVGMNIFDQNRFFAGFGYQLHRNHWIQLGYMNMFIQNPDGFSRRNIHVPRLFYFHNLNFYQKKT